MDKKADGDICAHLLCFSTIFSEIRSTSVFFRGRLNGAVKSDLTLPHSAHFAIQTASKKDAYAESVRKIGRKRKKMCANIPIGFFVHCPFQTTIDGFCYLTTFWLFCPLPLSNYNRWILLFDNIFNKVVIYLDLDLRGLCRSRSSVRL